MRCAVLPSTSSFAICALLIQCISYLDVNLWVAHHSNAEGVEMRSWHGNQPRLNSNFISLLTEVLFGLVYCNVQPIHQALLLICFIFDSILLGLGHASTICILLPGWPSPRNPKRNDSWNYSTPSLSNWDVHIQFNVLLWNDKHSETCSETSFWSLAYISVFVLGGLCLMWQLDCGMQWVLPRENLGQSSSMFFQWNHIAVSCLWIRIADMDSIAALIVAQRQNSEVAKTVLAECWT